MATRQIIADLQTTQGVRRVRSTNRLLSDKSSYKVIISPLNLRTLLETTVLLARSQSPELQTCLLRLNSAKLGELDSSLPWLSTSFKNMQWLEPSFLSSQSLSCPHAYLQPLHITRGSLFQL